MKLFLAWSGETSRRAGEAFHYWIPNVLQTVVPFMSEEDIAIGSRWSRQLDNELEESNFGIIFVTPDNHNKPWLLFEAGALSKSIADSRVSPLLIGVSRTELTGPLTHFQSALPEQGDVKRLVMSINEACGDSKLEDERLERVFNTWWGELETTLNSLVSEINDPDAATEADRRPDREIISETLEMVRSMQRAFSDPSVLLPPEYLQLALSNMRSDLSDLPEDLFIDLEHRWHTLTAVAGEMPQIEGEGEETLWGNQLEHAIANLQGPLEYLLREVRGHSTHGRRSRRTSP